MSISLTMRKTTDNDRGNLADTFRCYHVTSFFNHVVEMSQQFTRVPALYYVNGLVNMHPAFVERRCRKKDTCFFPQWASARVLPSEHVAAKSESSKGTNHSIRASTVVKIRKTDACCRLGVPRVSENSVSSPKADETTYSLKPSWRYLFVSLSIASTFD